MIFKSDKFIFNGINSEEMGIRLVDSQTRDILNEYSIPFAETIKIENSFNGNPLYTYEYSAPEKVELEFCLANDYGKAYEWTQAWEEKIVSWFMQDKFCEFISMDYPDLVYYLKGTKVSRKRDKELKGMMIVEFQPYFKHPIRKLKKSVFSNGEIEFLLNCDSSYKDLIYPIIKVEPTGKGKLEIKNLSIADSESLIINDLENEEKLIIDNNIYLVVNDKEQNMFHKVNREWFKFRAGKNKIRITGNAKVEFLANIEVRV